MTLLVEVYGPDFEQQQQVARQGKRVFEETNGVVDVDWRVVDEQTKYSFRVNKEKAMRAGAPTARIMRTTRMAVSGQDVTEMHLPEEREPFVRDPDVP